VSGEDKVGMSGERSKERIRQRRSNEVQISNVRLKILVFGTVSHFQ